MRYNYVFTKRVTTKRKVDDYVLTKCDDYVFTKRVTTKCKVDNYVFTKSDDYVFTKSDDYIFTKRVSTKLTTMFLKVTKKLPSWILYYISALVPSWT